MRVRNLLIMTVVFAALAGAAPFASAAESFDSCVGFIDSVPKVITTPGVWCLRKNITTAMSSGSAIDIQGSHVTIDCNGFRLIGLPAGPGTSTTAISAFGSRAFITVRHCAIRGFRTGIAIYANNPGMGHLVEDNQLEEIRSQGIYVLGRGSIVRRNTVLNTGGAPGEDRAQGITVFGDAIDNLVDGIAGATNVANFAPSGIYSGGVGNISGVGFLVQGNRIRNLVPKGTSQARGLELAGYAQSVRDNTIGQLSPTNGIGIYCSLGSEDVLRDNTVRNYTQGLFGSRFDFSGNVVY